MATLGTYARTLMSENVALTRLIHEYASEINKSPETSLLTANEVNHALNHPHAHFIHLVTQAYAKYLKAQGLSGEINTKFQQQLDFLVEALATLELQQAGAFGKDLETIGDVIAQMRQLYLELIVLGQSTNQHQQKLQVGLSQLNAIAEVIDQDWQTLRHTHEQTILNTLERANFPLDDNEKKLLLDDIGWGALLEKVNEAQVPLPEHIDVNEPNPSTYFYLKTYLVMTLSLRRRDIDVTAEELERL